MWNIRAPMRANGVADMNYRLIAALAVVSSSAAVAQRQPAASPTTNVPPAGTWERRAPEAVGLDAAKIQEAVAFAKEREAKTPRDLEENHYQTNAAGEIRVVGTAGQQF